MGAIKSNCELGVSEFLERCVEGFPPNVLPSVAIAGHRIAWSRFQATGEVEWREVAENCVHAITMARAATAAEAAALLQYIRELPTSAWFTATGWDRRRVKSCCLADARRDLVYLERHPQT